MRYLFSLFLLFIVGCSGAGSPVEVVETLQMASITQNEELLDTIFLDEAEKNITRDFLFDYDATLLSGDEIIRRYGNLACYSTKCYPKSNGLYSGDKVSIVLQQDGKVTRPISMGLSQKNSNWYISSFISETIYYEEIVEILLLSEPTRFRILSSEKVNNFSLHRDDKDLCSTTTKMIQEDVYEAICPDVELGDKVYTYRINNYEGKIRGEI